MAEATTMTVPPGLPVKSHHQSQGGRQTVSILAVAPTLSQTPSEAGATVYVAGSNPGETDSTSVWRSTITEVHSSNGYSAKGSKSDYPAHVVKIQINPEFDNTRVISTVRLNPEANIHLDNSKNESFNERLSEDARINEKNTIN